MQRANHQAIVHTANNNLVNIRNAEVQFFNQFYTSFGTQAALIAGFTGSSVSSVIGVGAPCSVFWILLYWLTTAISFTGAMHVLLCTVFLSVYGQGLALRGPIGSMAKALDGLIIEQKQIIIAFNITFIAFGVSNIGCYWIMMNTAGAIASTILTFVGMLCWYHYGLRIFNTFNFTPDPEVFRDSDLSDEPATIANYSRLNGRRLRRNTDDVNNKPSGSFLDKLFANNNNSTLSNRPRSSSQSLSMPVMNSGLQAESKTDEGHVGALRDNSNSNSNSRHAILFHGNLSLQVPMPATAFALEAYTWRRVYVVINDNKLFYYNDRKSYEQDPQDSLRKRPVLLENFFLAMDSVEPPYLLTLTPIAEKVAYMSSRTSETSSVTNTARGNLGDETSSKKQIRFRCDTTAEVANWIDILNKAMELGNHIATAAEISTPTQPRISTANSVHRAER